MSSSLPSFEDLFRRAECSAVHLEMRDVYAVKDEGADFARWRATGQADVDPDSEHWRPWVAMLQDAVKRGIRVRRARIVSMPVTDHIRYEYALTTVNVFAGEAVRWLSRRGASDIALPGIDFWLFDGKYVRINHFTGDGDSAEEPFEDSDDPALAQLCATSFEAVWRRATPHDAFVI
ncbi:MAG: hypothetical protein JO100_17510 [Pseudonocardia sp.]|nr:hypothetical protein [Pseudonocardia sp.]